MSTQTIEQVQRLAPYLEGLEKRILQSAFGEFDGDTQTSKGLLDTALDLPEYQVAGMDPLQLAAQQQALNQFGMFQPFHRILLEGAPARGAVLRKNIQSFSPKR